MPQSLASVAVHAVFSTRDRKPMIADPTNLHAYIGGVSKKLGCQPLIVGGVADHVHILANLARTVTVANWIKEIKRVSSIYMKPHEPEFSWQSGYGAFSVDPKSERVLRAYIANQEEHHRTVDFQDEFRQILREYGLQWDERYVWD